MTSDIQGQSAERKGFDPSPVRDDTDWHVLAQDIANHWVHPEERAVAYQAAAEAIKLFRAALGEAVYAIRNAAETSEWHRRHASRPFDHQDFRVWADHWQEMHSVVREFAAKDDARARGSA